MHCNKNIIYLIFFPQKNLSCHVFRLVDQNPTIAGPFSSTPDDQTPIEEQIKAWQPSCHPPLLAMTVVTSPSS